MNSEWVDVSKKVLENPHDFSLWQLLIHSSEHPSSISLDLEQAQLQLLRKSYSAILAKYPLLSKYWSSFAKWEYKLGNREQASNIFLEGMKYVSYDVQYWIEFLNFKLETITDSTEDVLHYFEEARSKIGFCYYSSEFYSLYLSFLKTYATNENTYEEKLILLLRQIVEIPLYNSVIFFKELLELIGVGRITYDKLRKLVLEPQLKDLKMQTKNHLPTISKKLEKIFTDSFAVIQFESLQIFGFERRLGKYLQFNCEPINCEDIGLWRFYLQYIELKYPFAYVKQLYERLVVVSEYYPDFVIRYFDLLLLEQQTNYARSLMERALSLNPTAQNISCFIRLLDLEISVGRIRHCRDLMVAYLEVNGLAPLELYEKLIHVEAMTNDDDDDGTSLCELTTAIVAKTNSCDFLVNLRNYPIHDGVLKDFLSQFVNNGGKYYNLGKQIKLEQHKAFKDFYRSI